MPKKIFNYGRQFIDSDDIKAVTTVLKSSFLTQGKCVIEFENLFSKKTNSNFSVSCTNGTSALHLAFKSISVDEKDCVIVPGITFVATANAAIMCGAQVVFCDVDPKTGLSEKEHYKKAFEIATSKGLKVKAIVVVHLNGQIANLENIFKFARSNDIFVIEDACHALGTSYYSKKKKIKVGSCAHSDIATFSFHPVKTITTGEGGMINTKHKWIYEKVKTFRNHGIIRESDKFVNKNNALDDGEYKMWYYEMQEVGFNYRLSDISCALGISQIKKLNKFVRKRKKLVEQYDKYFSKYTELISTIKKNNSLTSWHLYVVLINFKKLRISKNKFMINLKKRGIITQVHYIPLYRQPFFKNYEKLSGCEDYYSRAISLPLHYSITNADIKKISTEIIKTITNLVKN